MIVGHQKGRGTKENIKRNFGQPRPEGFRKARRLMELGARLGLPVITFIDTVGAYPGIEATSALKAQGLEGLRAHMAALAAP